MWRQSGFLAHRGFANDPHHPDQSHQNASFKQEYVVEGKDRCLLLELQIECLHCQRCMACKSSHLEIQVRLHLFQWNRQSVTELCQVINELILVELRFPFDHRYLQTLFHLTRPDFSGD